MKRIIFSLALLLLVVKLFAQTETSKPISKDFYLKKSKTQKTIAWSLLVGGTVMAVAGGASFDNSWNSGSYTATDVSGFIMLAGVVADIASIPFFISSGKNKKRALSVALNNQKIFVPQLKAFKLNTQPSLALKIGL
jgi:hypothetical protein